MHKRQTLWLANQSLVDNVGHHAGYNRLLAAAAKHIGWQVKILGQISVNERLIEHFPVKGVFHKDWRSSPPLWATKSVHILNFLEKISAKRFEADLRKGLSSSVEGDAIFAQMLSPRHLTAWLHWYCKKKEKPYLIFHLGYESSRFVSYRGLQNAITESNRQCIFVSDSEILCKQYENILQRTVHYLPHVISENIITSMPKRGQEMPTVLTLGSPRHEKGFNEMVAAALQTSSVKFIFQVNHSESQCFDSVEILRNTKASNIQLLEAPLNDNDYFSILASCDVVAVPYHLAVYRDRTSGVFCEAMAAGKPVITTRGSWMSTQYENCGWIVNDRDVADLRRIVEQIPEELEQKSQWSQSKAVKFREKFSARHFMDIFEGLLRHA